MRAIPGIPVNACAWAINERGEIIGTTWIANGPQRAFFWSPISGLRILGEAQAVNALAINDRGEMAGYRMDEGGRTHAVVWSPEGRMSDIGELGGAGSIAYGINNRGEVVGWSYINEANTFRAFVWTSHDGMREVKVIDDPDPYLISLAMGITRNGTIVGARRQPGTNWWRAFVLSPRGELREIDPGLPPEEMWQMMAADATEAGMVVGTLVHAGNGLGDAFAWTEANGVELLPSLGNHAGATAVNERGAVVGYRMTIDGYSRATLWTRSNNPSIPAAER